MFFLITLYSKTFENIVQILVAFPSLWMGLRKRRGDEGRSGQRCPICPQTQFGFVSGDWIFVCSHVTYIFDFQFKRSIAI